MDMEGLALLKNFNRDFFRKNLFWGKVRVGSEKEIDFRRTSAAYLVPGTSAAYLVPGTSEAYLG